MDDSPSGLKVVSGRLGESSKQLSGLNHPFELDEVVGRPQLATVGGNLVASVKIFTHLTLRYKCEDFSRVEEYFDGTPVMVTPLRLLLMGGRSGDSVLLGKVGEEGSCDKSGESYALVCSCVG